MHLSLVCLGGQRGLEFAKESGMVVQDLVDCLEAQLDDVLDVSPLGLLLQQLLNDRGVVCVVFL